MFVFLISCIIVCAFAQENKTDLTECRTATAAPNVQFKLLAGIWYVQQYTSPTNVSLQTKCDVLNISVNDDGISGQINYTFIVASKGENVVQLANWTAENNIGKFEYWMDIANVHIIMKATVLHLDEQFLLHAACPENMQGPETILVASKSITVTEQQMQSLVEMASKQGGQVTNLKQVNQNCTRSGTTAGQA